MRALFTLLAFGLALPAAAQDPDQVTMTLNEFIKMYEAAKNRPDKPEKAPKSHALASANYKGEVVMEDGEPVSAVFEASIKRDA